MRILVASLLLVLLSGGCDPGALVFEDARIRLPVPGSDKSVGYFQLTNTTGADISISSAEAVGVRTIEFHTMTMDGDMMRMRRLSEFLVPAGERVAFVSGGKHLMMFGVGELGESVAVTFSSDDGVEYSHHFAVRAPVANN